MDSRAQGCNHASKVEGGIQAKPESGARKRLRLDGGDQIEGKAREKAGEGSGEGAQ